MQMPEVFMAPASSPLFAQPHAETGLRHGLWRLVQIACAVVAIAGLAPWASMFGAIVSRAIDSEQPLIMCVAAWLVMLMPVWVIWFALVAWRRRDFSLTPAILTTLPTLLIAGGWLLLARPPTP